MAAVVNPFDPAILNPGILNLGGRREVFWDDFLLETDLPGVCVYPRPPLIQETPQKKEIVLRLDKPWEGRSCGYFHYFFDGRRFRFYYRASDGLAANSRTDVGLAADKRTADKLSRSACICVLLSDDGVHWERPDLGLVEFDGSRRNNIVYRGDELDNFFVFRDENPACVPDQLYKAISQGPKTPGLPNGGLWAFVSPDGFVWKPLSGEPIMREGFFDTLNTAHWDSGAGRYRIYFRGFHSNGFTAKCRDIRTSMSDDFIHWDNEQPLRYSAAESSAAFSSEVSAPEEQLYTNAVIPYYRAPHIHVGFPVRYTERQWEPMFDQLPHKQWRTQKMKRFNEPRLGTALTDSLFMMSRNGLDFKRYDGPFLTPGLFGGYNWVYGDCYQGWGLLETSAQKEISFFAGEDYTSQPVSIRRYTVRQDGFACLSAGRGEKQILTKPFIFCGNTLTLNAGTSAAGFIMAEFLEPGGNPIPGFSGESGYRMFGDHTGLKVIFRRGEGAIGDLSALEGKPVRIRFTLREAKLYSMQFVRLELP
ncbi:MAG: hypothetical protein FWD78_06360 [Treponema sp.]|nr:hypothetical protein [Treponema sp.]